MPTSSHRLPFYPPVPITFGGDLPARKSRRRRQPAPQTSAESVELPESTGSFPEKSTPTPVEDALNVEAFTPAKVIADLPVKLETPLTSQPPSEVFSTQPTTPSPTAQHPQKIPQQATSKVNASGRPNSTHMLPIVPAVPNIPTVSRPSKHHSMSIASEAPKVSSPSNGDRLAAAVEAASTADEFDAMEASVSKNDAEAPAAKVIPKSWVDIVRSNAPKMSNGSAQANGMTPHSDPFATKNVHSLAEALNSFTIKDGQDASKLSFLEPRGLVNTGNMCYMNSVRFA